MPHHHNPFLPTTTATDMATAMNMGSPTRHLAVMGYYQLIGGRGILTIGGAMFVLMLTPPTSLILHLVAILILILEAAAAKLSQSSDVHIKRRYTLANLVLYFSFVVTILVAAFIPSNMDKINPPRNNPGHSPWPEHPNSGSPFPFLRIFFHIPDFFVILLTFGSFFTLPALRIKHWRTMPRDDGRFLGGGDGDSIPVIVYSDFEDEESGALAEAFRAQQQQEGQDDDAEVLIGCEAEEGRIRL
ncbi:hypothetical protein B0T17DRAFT_616608 [Bombardia bombarda]|uniref:Uncharacterized protein n=1 Tax=Bombardia bombarda TaxID=252184 RepID=A0AA39XBT3_9PEZI|nr:hypothetical protein B0T17DRAFT_616608 [Bombardia bombarda]